MALENENAMRAWTGRSVEIELRYTGGDVERLTLDIVKDQFADFDGGLLGESTPLAKAIIGVAAGSAIDYRAGDIVGVRVLAVGPARQADPEDLSARREEATRKAIDDADRTNLMIYASAMNSKWGDYDPSILQQDQEEDGEDKKDKQ